MTETKPTTDGAGSPPILAGLLAEFDGPEALLAAAEKVRDAGYRRWDAHSPYPIHGIERAMGIRPTVLPWLVLGAGVGGAAVALLMQWWMNAVDYPLVISGKPLFSLPANIPIAFELIVLCSAFAAFGGALALSRLPQFWHPVFSAERFRRATTDGFFLSIEAADPQFDPAGTGQLLASLGATAVEACHEPDAGRNVPRALFAALAAALLLAVLPPLWIARARSVTSNEPRIHLIQDMDFQPRYQAQAEGPFFDDRRAMRPSVAGTIAVGQLDADDHLHRGRVGGTWATAFPIPVAREAMEQGRQRFNIYCAPCHGLAGEGDGMIARRAAQRIIGEQPGFATWVAPRSLHASAVVEQPVGQLFHTITNGLNTMPAYAAQIPVEDRWKIVLYERALQRSQKARLEDVPEAYRSQLK